MPITQPLTQKERQAYFTDIENAKSLFTKKMKDTKDAFRVEMKTYKRYLRGMFTSEEIGMEKPVPLNEFNTAVATLKPNLYFSNPYVNVIPMDDKFSIQKIGAQKPVDVDAKQQAATAEFLLNYTSNIELNDEKMFNDCLEDALVPGFAVHKSAWIFKAEEQANLNNVEWGTKDTAQLAGQDQMDRLMALKQEQGDTVEGEKPLEIPTAEKDTIYSDRVSPFNILPDPECRDWEDLSSCRFICEIHRINTNYVNNLFGVKLSGTSINAFADDVDTDNDEITLNLKQSVVYEIWDKVKQRIVYLTPEQPDKELMVKDWWKIKEYPYEFLVFFKENDRALPIPWFRMWKDVVFEKMRLRSKMSELNKRMFQTWLADSKISGELDRILNGGSGNVIPIERKNNESLEGYLKLIADFTINPSYFEYNKLINADIDRYSGISDMMRGLVSDSKRTASEIMQLNEKNNIRIDYMQKRFKRWIINIFSKRLQLYQQNLVLKKRLYFQSGGQNVDMNPNMDDIQGKFYFDLDVNSMIKKNKEVAKKQSMEKLEALAGFPQENVKMLLEDVHEAFGDSKIAERVKDLPPAPPPAKPELRISLSLKGDDLANPMVDELIKSYGVDIVVDNSQGQPQGAMPGQGNMPIKPPQPQDENSMAVDIQKGANSV